MKKLKLKVRNYAIYRQGTIRVGHSRSSCLLFCSAAEAEAKEKADKDSGKKEDYKGDSKFASHLKTSAGVSSFAKNRTLKEQREYLPAFACREELMRIIRDNQGLPCPSRLYCMAADHISI